MSIGSNIKKLRREREITQEQLAEYLHLTPSAISQWETDRVLPDIMQLPQLANIVRVSTDVILGVDVERKDAKIQEIWEKADKLSCAGRKEEAAEVCREGLREFPDAYVLMEELANCLYYVGSYSEQVPEIISLYEKVLENAKDESSRNYAVGNLCGLYTRTGDVEKARQLAESIPFQVYTREECYRSTLRGVEWIEDFRSSICRRFDALLFDIRNLIGGARNVIVDGKPFYSDEDALELYRKIIVFAETFFEKGDYGFTGELLGEVYYERACRFLRLGDGEKALAELETAVEHILTSDAYGEGLVGQTLVEVPPEKLHTSILALPGPGDDAIEVRTPTEHNNAMEYLGNLNDSVFDPIRSDPRFAELETRLRENAK